MYYRLENSYQNVESCIYLALLLMRDVASVKKVHVLKAPILYGTGLGGGAGGPLLFAAGGGAGSVGVVTDGST